MVVLVGVGVGVVVVMAVMAMMMTLSRVAISMIGVAIGICRVGRRERLDFLEVAQFVGAATIRRTRVGSQVQGLRWVEDGSAWSRLE